MSPYFTLADVKTAADEYWRIWQQLLTEAPELRRAIGQHSADALGWKVEGELAPLEAGARVYELGDSLHLAPVNGERAILTVRKVRAVALDTLQHIKILQRRPSRPGDALGPDSLDFVVPHGLPKLQEVEAAVSVFDVTVEAQHNDGHKWLSVIYLGHEFKLANHPVWEVCVREAAGLLDLSVRRG